VVLTFVMTLFPASLVLRARPAVST
jgi:hypothetical protein